MGDFLAIKNRQRTAIFSAIKMLWANLIPTAGFPAIPEAAVKNR